MQSIKLKLQKKQLRLNLNKPIAVIGAGAWGSALAVALARNGSSVRLFGDNLDDLAIIAKQHQNPKFLGDILLPDTIIPCFTLQDALQGCQDILMVVPSHVFRNVLQDMKPLLSKDVRIAFATKGLDPSTQELMSEVTQEVLGEVPLAVISGPSFALEVAKGIPTAVALAGNDPQFLSDLQARFKGHGFYLQPCDDLIGVQIGGALKNAIAIVCGMSDGLGYGANTHSALISVGLQQMMGLGLAMGAVAKTFMGLAGLGDLVLTCTDDQSRNRRFGLALGHGKNPADALAEIGQTVEGLQNVAQIIMLCERHHVKMPIVAILQKVLNNQLAPSAAIIEMMTEIH